jgi:hypothetical protein
MYCRRPCVGLRDQRSRGIHLQQGYRHLSHRAFCVDRGGRDPDHGRLFHQRHGSSRGVLPSRGLRAFRIWWWIRASRRLSASTAGNRTLKSKPPIRSGVRASRRPGRQTARPASRPERQRVTSAAIAAGMVHRPAISLTAKVLCCLRLSDPGSSPFLRRSHAAVHQIGHTKPDLSCNGEHESRPRTARRSWGASMTLHH